MKMRLPVIKMSISDDMIAVGGIFDTSSSLIFDGKRRASSCCFDMSDAQLLQKDLTVKALSRSSFVIACLSLRYLLWVRGRSKMTSPGKGGREGQQKR